MKPKIICHIMSSVDGRLIDGRWTDPYEAEHGDLLKVYAAIGHELNTEAWNCNICFDMCPEKSEMKTKA